MRDAGSGEGSSPRPPATGQLAAVSRACGDCVSKQTRSVAKGSQVWGGTAAWLESSRATLRHGQGAAGRQKERSHMFATMFRRPGRAVAAALGLASGVLMQFDAVRADGSHHGGSRYSGKPVFTVALFGDAPYGDLGREQYPNLIADVNAAHVALAIHTGDLKSGGDGPCTDENLYFPALEYFNSFKAPVTFVVGDNDWTDCWGLYGPATTAPGADDPLALLQHERDLFFSTGYTMGQRKLRMKQQSSMGGEYAQYAENWRIRLGSVVFIGVNVQGSNDNYPYFGVNGETRSDAEIARMRAEAVARKAAVLVWLSEGFEYAKRIRADGVMVVMQANLNFNNERHQEDTRLWDAFPDYINALRDETMAFNGQVALVHGDAHYFHMDKPINTPAGGVLHNFTRVETFGARNNHWVSATIDPSNPNVFTFEPRMVPENID